MSDRNRFFTPDSPLQGRKLPPDWDRLTDLNAKRRALIAMGYAENFSKASNMLAGHSAAVKNHRRDLAEALGRGGGKFSPED